MLTPVWPRESSDPTRPAWRCGIRVRQAGETAIVSPHGELDIAAAPRLKLLLSELSAASTRHITVDCTDVTFLDTAGLRVLLEFDRLLHARGGGLRLSNASARIVRLLHVTRTTHLLGRDGVGASAPVSPVAPTGAADAA